VAVQQDPATQRTIGFDDLSVALRSRRPIKREGRSHSVLARLSNSPDQV